MLACEYSARSEINVVIVPAPAISGKAKGTTVECPTSGSDLKKSTPKTISKPSKNIIKPPAMAKEATSRPKSCKISCPTNKKATIKIPETTVACKALSSPSFFLRKSIIIGIEPKISMTENKISDTDAISLKLNSMFF